MNEVFELLKAAKKPLLIAGNGVRLAGAVKALETFMWIYKTPVVTSMMAADIVPVDHPLYIGRIGYKGHHAANLAVENADLVLVIGCRLSLPAISFLNEKFAPNAKVVVVDIDS